MLLVYRHYKGLSVAHINLECLIRIRAGATVSNPIGAEVVRIEAPQICRSEDVMVSAAHRIRIDRHALSCAGGVSERVSIVTEGIRITKDRTRRRRRTGLRDIAVGEFIRVRRIANVNGPVNHDRSARGRWAGATTTAVVAMIYIRQELEGCSVYPAYTPDVPVSVEARLVSLPGRLWQVGGRGHPGSTRPR